MYKQLYDKNEYENYPSYLMGKKRENNSINKKFDNYKIDQYNFEGAPEIPYFLAGGYGLLGGLAFYVYGTSKIEKDNILCVSISATFPKGSEVTGGVKVVCNNNIYSECTFKKNPSGYIYEYGTAEPIGEAKVELPLNGAYKIEVVVSNIVHDSGRAILNYKTELPYSKF